MYEDDDGDGDMPLYFEKSTDLMDIFTQMEENNLL